MNTQPATPPASAQPPVDATRCPLCGGPNGCVMATLPTGAQAPRACWCTQATFSPALLAQVPAQARSRACICARCVASSSPA